MRTFPTLFPFFQPAAQAVTGRIDASPLLLAKSPETIDAQRRRRSSGGPRGRADMPGRPSGGGGSGGYTPGGGGGGGSPFSGGGGGLPGGKGLPIGMVILIVIAFALFNLFSGNQGGDTSSTGQDFPPDEPAQSLPTQPLVARATATRGPTRTPAAPAAGDTWTVMLYQDADDSVLEQDIYMDLNEAEKVGSDANVNIVSQIDRFTGGFAADGDWTSTRRYYLTQDDDLTRVRSELVDDLGEVSMADPQTLIDFVTWAVTTYPADKYVLILSDHGMGWPGGMTDPRPAAKRNVDTNFSRAIEANMLYLDEIDQALGEIRRQTGIERFELIGLDACLMSHVEVYSALSSHARYVVNSQETEPALGWAYTSFLTDLVQDPGMDGAGLSEAIVASYIEEDQRIQDQQARLEYLSQGSPMGGLFGRANDIAPLQLSRQISKTITLSAADMSVMPELLASLDQLAYALQSESQAVVARAKTYAQSFTSVFGRDVPPSYIDLGNFAQMLQQESRSAAVRDAAGAVIAAVDQVVIAEKHGPQKPGSTGISIYFPNSQLYQNAVAGARSYAQVAERFTEDSVWDDFLAFHYTQRGFDLDSRAPVVPEANSRFSAPGTGDIQVSALSVSPQTAAYDQPVILQADLTGTNIGYVYLFVGYYDAASQSILVADKDYLESPETKRVGDLFYPAWSDDETFRLRYTWTPTVFAISDGQTEAVALLEPVLYGASAEDALYSSEGIYTDSSSGEQRYARMYFSDGQLRQVVVYSGSQPVGAVREVTPKTGDQITLVQTWLEDDGSGGYRQVSELGQTLTFSDQMFTWQELYADAGTYVVGFLVTDLDGNQKQTLGTVQIR